MGCCSHFHPLDFIRGIVKEREQFPCEVSPTILSTYLQHQKPKGTIRPLGNPNMLPPENVGKIRIEIVWYDWQVKHNKQLQNESGAAILINLIKLKLNEVLLLYHKMDILAEILTHHNIQLIWR